MSWTNGRLLGVDGLVVAEGKVTPMSNPDEVTCGIVKRRTIKPKGTVGERKSRRRSS